MARTVLLADDSVTAQNMGRRILMDAGYEVVTVNNGSAALKKIHESKPDLIVLDVYMPGYGGLEVCQRLKESGETARIPVLLSVGKMEPFKADEARRVRADGHIVKPFEASELLAALTRLEDRIVPQAESSSGRRGKAEKKSRSWHAEDPLTEFAQVPTDQISYLAEVKKRQSHSDAPSETAGAPVKQESAPAPANPDQMSAESTTSSALTASVTAASSAPTAEFTVQESAIPSESGGHDEPPRVELRAAEPVVESPAPVEASSVERFAGETPASVIAASKESIPDESAPEVPAEPAAVAEVAAVATASSPVSTARWAAENVALTAEEASIALETEMQQAQAIAAAAIEPEVAAQDQVTSSSEAVAQAAPEVESVNSSGAAFAAAAGSQQSAVSSQPASAGVGDTALVPEAEPLVPSEATAAWENWQQIRESVMSPQKAAAIAESVAELAQATAAVQEPTSKKDIAPSEGASVAPAEEDNSINDIVDSVLADLKPRLMQEIAKKLAAKK